MADDVISENQKIISELKHRNIKTVQDSVGEPERAFLNTPLPPQKEIERIPPGNSANKSSGDSLDPILLQKKLSTCEAQLQLVQEKEPTVYNKLLREFKNIKENESSSAAVKSNAVSK